jgi:hypothetical protein
VNCLSRLDYDNREDMREGVRRMRFLLRGLPDTGHVFQMQRHKTRRGWHIEIFSTLSLCPAEMVALQAILNSDYKREAFNLFRVHQLPLAPQFWHALPNWNILHTEKITA